MLCSATAWYWLISFCGPRVKELVEELAEDPDRYKQSPDWLARLCHDVYSDISWQRRRRLDAGDYFEHLQGQDVTGKVARPRNLEDNFLPRVENTVLSFVRTWLSYPNNTEMLRAYLVVYILQAFRNSDVLMLEGVWRYYREVKAGVLGLPRSDHPGLAALHHMVQQLLPIARGDPIPSPTAVQQAVLRNSDHFSPFRNLATSRLRTTSNQGPFHPDNVDKPGAYPSCVISRALIFDTPFQHDETFGYFSSKADWDAQDADAVKKCTKVMQAATQRILNVKCYGSPQAQRISDGMDAVKSYFEYEPKYNALLASHAPHPVPFVIFYDWTQGKEQITGKNGKVKNRRFKKLLLLGGLTGYLLTADLVYAGKVAPPTLAEVAEVLRRNKMGSLSGLEEAGLIRSKKNATEAEVLNAFTRVFNFLSTRIDISDKQLIGFDAVMVEHLLCKFSRLTSARKRDLAGKGKGRA
ncbi:hypothetical protein OH76DRAFT_1356310 [Lentinus brumalis]|uniref:Uncharacterized protein n=1 Tax=Lentinus brumalis TaxID=2498619 RepID=A0A371D0Z3_9APHY|nr:hypothetical protein OH76DRAFT_1356310 [Polyporus brumalis]